jgi:excisionase family DNA binding protein
MTMERRNPQMKQLMYRPGGRDAPTEYLLTVQEAADRLRVSRWSVYNLIRSNQLRTIKIGRRRLITPAAFRQLRCEVGLVRITQRRAVRQQKTGVGTITRRLLPVVEWFT